MKIERNVRRSGLGRKRLLVWALAWLSIAGLAMASEYHGQVTFGGLPVPGTTVKVTATQGNKTAVAITDEQGLYSFPDLADGTWTIEIEMTGFAPIKQEVTVAPNAPAGAFTMKLLTLEEMRAAAKPVTVEAATAVSTSAAGPESTGATASTAPAAAAGKKGAAAETPEANAPEPAAEPVQDATAQQANDGFLINGSVNNAATSQYSMSQAFGNSRNGGRSLYTTGLSLVLRNSAFDAKQYSLAGLDTAKPSYTDMTGGVTFAGPLKIPHLLPLVRAPYFYVSYSRTQNKNDSTQSALVPTAAEWGGDLSQQPNVKAIYVPSDMATLSPSCDSVLLGSGLTQSAINAGTAQFAGNVIPSACISKVVPNLINLNFYPAPNVAGNTQYNYQVPLVSSTHADVFQTQVYKQIGSKDNVNGSFYVQSSRSGSENLFSFHDSNNSLNVGANAGWYHRLTTRLSLNASYSFSRSRSQANPYFANRENVSQDMDIKGNLQDGTDYGPPSLSFSSGVAGLSDANSTWNRSETNSVSGSLQWYRFNHDVQVGGDFRRQEFNYLAQSNPRGSLNFNGAATQEIQIQVVNGVPEPVAVAGTGSDLADFLLGLPDASQIAYGNADKYLRQSVYDFYANDNFRVNPELSINAGVRWEYGAPVTETQGRLVNLDIAPGFVNEQPVLGSNPVGPLTGQSYPASLLRPDRSGISPRIGIAWRPVSGSSLLVRASYGIYNDTSVYQATAYAMATQHGTQQTPLSTSLSVSNSTACHFTILNPFSVPCSTTTPDTFAVDPNFRVGYAQLWQLSVQRDLPGSLQMVVEYKGTKGTRGVQEFVVNTYQPGLTVSPYGSAPSGYYYRTSNGNSTREAGAVTLRRRLRSGLAAGLTYTYSKSLDDDYAMGGQGSVASNGSGASPQVAQDWQNPSGQRGLSTFDQRHVLSANAQYTTGMGIGGKTLMSGWKGLAYKEWTVQTTISAASGLPETPIDPATLPGSGYSNIIRANYVGGPVHLKSAGSFLNSAAFQAPVGQWGNARRDSITGPNQFSLNASLDRTFRLHTRYNLETRLDATNVLNHVVYSSWITTVGSPQFGAPASANGMRSMSITMRLRF
ncbi:MAG: carboxypeptidase regulatory-like domain-containing protein [Acidobacteriaceae bacterium]